MRKIEFIAPVAAMRGNLSGSRKLVYPLHNNDAWEAPDNKRVYANNYAPRYIGAKRAKDSATLFAVKERSAITMSSAMRTQQALLGASVSLSSSMMKNPAILQNLMSAYQRAGDLGLTTKTLAKWVQEQVAIYLKDHNDFYFNLNSSTYIVANPYISSHAAGAVSFTASTEILVKFWQQLATNPIYFTVEGAKGVAHSGDDFQTVAASSYNVLGISATTLVKIGSQWIKDSNDQYVNGDDTITANGVYTLTNVNPAP